MATSEVLPAARQIARLPLAPQRDAPASLRQPFAEDMSGADYFRTDQHYRFAARTIAQHLNEMRGFVLVTGEPPPDGQAVELLLCDENRKALLLTCRPDMTFADLVGAYAKEVGLRIADDDSAPWSLMSHLMGEARRGTTHVLVLDKPELLDVATVNELFGLLRLDEPYVTPVVLLASPSFSLRFEEAPLNAHAPLLVARLSLQHLEREEVADFLRRQLAGASHDDAALFTPEIIDTIAQAANGNPLVVNRLARSVLISARESEEEKATADIPIEIPEPQVPRETVTSSGSGGARAIPLDRGDPLPRWLVPDRPEANGPADGRQSASRWHRLKNAKPRLPLDGRRSLRLVALATIAIAIFTLPLSMMERIIDFGLEGWNRIALPSAVFAPLPPADTHSEAREAVPETETISAGPSPQAEEPRRSGRRSGDQPNEPGMETAPAVEPSQSAVDDAPSEPDVANVPPAPAAIAAIPPNPDRATLSPAEIQTVIQRGQQLLSVGDVLSARLFFELAAPQDEDQAALGLGKSYDPFFLRRLGARGPVGDTAKAEMWYRKAANRGNLEALALLERLRSWSRP